MSNELILHCHRLAIKLYQATPEAASDHIDDENARRLIDELLNSSDDELLNTSNELLRSASSPGIASTMLMRFYPISQGVMSH